MTNDMGDLDQEVKLYKKKMFGVLITSLHIVYFIVLGPPALF